MKLSNELSGLLHLDLQINEKLTVEYQNSKIISIDGKFKVTPSTVDLTWTAENPYLSVRRQSLALSGRFEPANPRNEGSLVFTWSSPSYREPREVRVEIESERRPGQLRFKLTTATPIIRFESSELSFDYRILEDSKVHEIDLVVGLSDKKAKLNGRVNLSPAQREVDLTLNLPRSNPLRILARVSSQSPTHTVETRVDWGTGKIVDLVIQMSNLFANLFYLFGTSKGTFTVEGSTKIISSDDFEVSLKVHSPELGINNYEVKGSNKLQSKQRIMELTILRKSSTIAVLKSVYDRKDDRTGVQITGTAEVSAPESDMTGSIKYLAESRLVDSNDEKGRLFRMEVDVATQDFVLNKLNGHIKWTNKEKSESVGLCASDVCYEQTMAYKDIGVKPAVAKEAHILFKVKSNGVSEIRGMRLKHSSNNNRFEQIAEVL